MQAEESMYSSANKVEMHICSRCIDVDRRQTKLKFFYFYLFYYFLIISNRKRYFLYFSSQRDQSKFTLQAPKSKSRMISASVLIYRNSRMRRTDYREERKEEEEKEEEEDHTPKSKL